MTATVLEYDDFRITFERSGDVYPIVASGRAAEASATFRPPFSDIEIEDLVLKLNRPRAGGRRTDSSDVDLLRKFGRELYEALFTGPVRDVYRSSLHSARSRGIGMRIGLALGGTPELMHVPWELLYDEPTFLSISTWTPVVRCLELATPRTPLNVDPPVRILAMVSSPSDLAPLAIEKERATLEGSLDRLSGRGLVQIQWLERATLQALLRALRQGQFHIFHFVGHGRGYDRTTDDGTLTLEDSVGRSRLVTAEKPCKLAYCVACADDFLPPRGYETGTFGTGGHPRRLATRPRPCLRRSIATTHSESYCKQAVGVARAGANLTLSFAREEVIGITP
jgi:hypothetical protein